MYEYSDILIICSLQSLIEHSLSLFCTIRVFYTVRVWYNLPYAYGTIYHTRMVQFTIRVWYNFVYHTLVMGDIENFHLRLLSSEIWLL